MEALVDQSTDNGRPVLAGVDREIGDAALLAEPGEGAVHGLVDVAARAEIAQRSLRARLDEPFVDAGIAGQPHLFEMAQAGDQQPADFGIVRPLRLGPQVDIAQLVGLACDLPIEPRPAFGIDLTREAGADLVLGLGAEFGIDQLLGASAQAVADIIARDDEIGAGLVDAAHEQMDMRVVGVPVIDGDPVEAGAEVGFHLLGEIPREGAQVFHIGGVFRRDDEAEMVPVVLQRSAKARSSARSVSASNMTPFSPSRLTPSRFR